MMATIKRRQNNKANGSINRVHNTINKRATNK